MSTLKVNLPESLCRRAESLAKEDGVPLDEFIAMAIADNGSRIPLESIFKSNMPAT